MDDGNKVYKILLVEDNPGHAELIKRNLKKQEMAIEVLHLKDGDRALHYLFRKEEDEELEQESLPDLILLDLRLPKVDGLEVLKKIKKAAKFSHIPVVILTTSNSHQDLSKAYEYKVNSYLVKPIDYKEFNILLKDLAEYWFRCNHIPKER